VAHAARSADVVRAHVIVDIGTERTTGRVDARVDRAGVEVIADGGSLNASLVGITRCGETLVVSRRVTSEIGENTIPRGDGTSSLLTLVGGRTTRAARLSVTATDIAVIVVGTLQGQTGCHVKGRFRGVTFVVEDTEVVTLSLDESQTVDVD